MELAVDRVVLGHGDLEVKEGVTDGSNIHNSASTEGSSGDRVPAMAKLIHSDLRHCVSGKRLACRRRHSCPWDRGAESC